MYDLEYDELFTLLFFTPLFLFVWLLLLLLCQNILDWKSNRWLYKAEPVDSVAKRIF